MNNPNEKEISTESLILIILQLMILTTLSIISYIYEGYICIFFIILFTIIFILGNTSRLRGALNLLQDTIYNKGIVPYTTKIYLPYLQSIPQGSLILDVGIGNAKALLAHSHLIKQKNLHILGCDINPATVRIARNNIREKEMDAHIQVKLQDIFKYESADLYDIVVFSECWAVIPCIQQMVLHSRKFLKPKGIIIILTALDDKRSRVKDFIKPNIRRILGEMNDFGRSTTVAQMDHFLCHNFSSYEKQIIYERNIRGYGSVRSYMVIINLDEF